MTEEFKNPRDITVAAYNSADAAKAAADFICSGLHDERTVQKAIEAALEQNKNVFLFDGVYRIDEFYDFGDGGPKTALLFPACHRELTFCGQNKTFFCKGKWDNGVIFWVSREALDGTKDEPCDVMRSAWAKAGIFNGTGLNLKNICIILYNNQHPVRCVDLRRTWNVEAYNIKMNTLGYKYAENTKANVIENSVAAEGCIGMTLTDGSNNAGNNFTNVFASGFYEGIQVGGEHPILINCAGSDCVYGFTFGNYAYNCGANHPITMINCCDEQNINLPLFAECGDGGGTLPGGQEVKMISYNLERVQEHTPGGKLGDAMRETVPGNWCGSIEFTAQPAWSHTNIVDFKLWEDGCGTGFVTRNSLHKTVCSTAERLTYYPSYGQQIFDTDLNKMLVCINPAEKKWVDFAGNAAD